MIVDIFQVEHALHPVVDGISAYPRQAEIGSLFDCDEVLSVSSGGGNGMRAGFTHDKLPDMHRAV